MKLTKRILCAAIVAVMMLSMMLAGCSAPKLIIGGTPDVAGTVADKEISTGEYLAYLYNTFYTMYYDQGLYYYEYYGMDPWTQQFTYGEGDDAVEVELSEYITMQTQDTIVRQEALTQMMAEYGISWIEDEEKEIDEELSEMSENNFIDIGFTNEKFITVYKNLYLNERSAFFGLYGEGGDREVTEEELREYFDENYLSYKTITVALLDEDGEELDEDAKKKITDELNGYLEQYNTDKDFEKVVDAYNEAQGEEDTEVEASTDEDNRISGDAVDMDTDLVEAIRTVDVGAAKVVTYQADGTTPTAALILRLDINDEEQGLFEDSEETILQTLKYEEFDEEVTEAANNIEAKFSKSVVNKCKPENFVETAT